MKASKRGYASFVAAGSSRKKYERSITSYANLSFLTLIDNFVATDFRLTRCVISSWLKRFCIRRARFSLRGRLGNADKRNLASFGEFRNPNKTI